MFICPSRVNRISLTFRSWFTGVRWCFKFRKTHKSVSIMRCNTNFYPWFLIQFTYSSMKQKNQYRIFTCAFGWWKLRQTGHCDIWSGVALDFVHDLLQLHQKYSHSYSIFVWKNFSTQVTIFFQIYYDLAWLNWADRILYCFFVLLGSSILCVRFKSRMNIWFGFVVLQSRNNISIWILYCKLPQIKCKYLI